ncbi:phytoene desaturase family protein [Singulisphaera sp. PoT]|uniref:phytoene desaturase family protein n=1 Tax=Singulisphaera sp. PoT TaxID=3411797 RepID=UPI003BF4CF09
MHDVAIIGGGIAGMATAARLQARGFSTVVLEAHGQPGGCAGFYRRKGFSFDVGATTLVDFGPGGVGGELLEAIGAEPLDGEALPGYVGWLPDRTVALHRDPAEWDRERLRAFGETPAHRGFWQLLDRLSSVFWGVSRRGVKLPIQSLGDAIGAARALGWEDGLLARYVRWTVADALQAYGLSGEDALKGLLAMIVEDTVHSSLDKAPLIDAALGVTIRGAGLHRARGGMRGFWRGFVDHYRSLGGELRVGCAVDRIEGQAGAFRVITRRGVFGAARVVSALPAGLTARLGPAPVARKLEPYLRRDAAAQGGAIVVFLGVPEDEVDGQAWTHHQLLQDYARPLGDGNNMFVSVSADSDLESAPPGHRAVMISTHCELGPWEGLGNEEYEARKREAGERLLGCARRVYPELGRRAVICEVATPRTFERFTRRPRGAVGGVKQSLSNANQNALPHDVGIPGFWLVGDSTWPGLGTVACCLGSRLVAEGILASTSRPKWICGRRARSQPANHPVPEYSM